MTKSCRKACPKCGKQHFRRVELCRSCEPVAPRFSDKPCAICGSPVLIGRMRSHSGYCSYTCAVSVQRARSKGATLVAKAVLSGELTRPDQLTCVDCGRPATSYDHRRYLRPLDVEPVCRSCNYKRGPAADVKEIVAKHLCVSVEEVPALMRAELARRRAAGEAA